MKKKLLFLLALPLLCAQGARADYPPDSQAFKQRVEQAVEEAAENQTLQVARTSVVKIVPEWKNPRGEHVKSVCKGVLVNEGKQLVSHANCMLLPRDAADNAKLDKVFLYFSNGLIYASGFLPPIQAGEFVYWNLPQLDLGDIYPAELSVSAGWDVIGQLGYDLQGAPQTTSEQDFVFLGKRGWRFGGFAGVESFTLSGALRERLFGEPVFIGKRVIALNGAGGKEGLGWGPWGRPVFAVFTKSNGGEILQKI